MAVLTSEFRHAHASCRVHARPPSCRARRPELTFLRACRTPAPGGSPETLGGSAADVRYLRLSPDATRLIYSADAEQDEITELYAIKPGGGRSLKLSLPFAAGRAGVIEAKFTPDGKRVVYLADHAARGLFELYSGPINGGPVAKISRPGGAR